MDEKTKKQLNKWVLKNLLVSDNFAILPKFVQFYGIFHIPISSRKNYLYIIEFLFKKDFELIGVDEWSLFFKRDKRIKIKW